jgi:hypothetical protein
MIRGMFGRRPFAVIVAVSVELEQQDAVGASGHPDHDVLAGRYSLHHHHTTDVPASGNPDRGAVRPLRVRQLCSDRVGRCTRRIPDQ